MNAMLPLPLQAEFATAPYYDLVMSDWQYTHGVRLPSLEPLVHACSCRLYQHLPTNLVSRYLTYFQLDDSMWQYWLWLKLDWSWSTLCRPNVPNGSKQIVRQWLLVCHKYQPPSWGDLGEKRADSIHHPQPVHALQAVQRNGSFDGTSQCQHLSHCSRQLLLGKVSGCDRGPLLITFDQCSFFILYILVHELLHGLKWSRRAQVHLSLPESCKLCKW